MHPVSGLARAIRTNPERIPPLGDEPPNNRVSELSGVLHSPRPNQNARPIFRRRLNRLPFAHDPTSVKLYE